jgi:hypothetical protein
MSATELIKQVAALPQRERVVFDQLFQAMMNNHPAQIRAGGSDWPDFSERLRAIYGDKMAPVHPPFH